MSRRETCNCDAGGGTTAVVASLGSFRSSSMPAHELLQSDGVALQACHQPAKLLRGQGALGLLEGVHISVRVASRFEQRALRLPMSALIE